MCPYQEIVAVSSEAGGTGWAGSQFFPGFEIDVGLEGEAGFSGSSADQAVVCSGPIPYVGQFISMGLFSFIRYPNPASSGGGDVDFIAYTSPPGFGASGVGHFAGPGIPSATSTFGVTYAVADAVPQSALVGNSCVMVLARYDNLFPLTGGTQVVLGAMYVGFNTIVAPAHLGTAVSLPDSGGSINYNVCGLRDQLGLVIAWTPNGSLATSVAGFHIDYLSGVGSQLFGYDAIGTDAAGGDWIFGSMGRVDDTHFWAAGNPDGSPLALNPSRVYLVKVDNSYDVTVVDQIDPFGNPYGQVLTYARWPTDPTMLDCMTGDATATNRWKLVTLQVVGDSITVVNSIEIAPDCNTPLPVGGFALFPPMRMDSRYIIATDDFFQNYVIDTALARFDPPIPPPIFDFPYQRCCLPLANIGSSANAAITTANVSGSAPYSFNFNGWSYGGPFLFPCCGPSAIPTRQFPRDDHLGLGAVRQSGTRRGPSSVQFSKRTGTRGTYS
jgi:hypothetical protein